MSSHQTINTKVAEQLAAIAPQVAENIINHLVTKELTRRSDAIIQAIATSEKLSKDLAKLKPDNVLYNEDGTVASSTYTKAKLDEKSKITTQIKKIEDAIEKALANNDYSLLFNLAKPQEA
jgi:hypothetical protein